MKMFEIIHIDLDQLTESEVRRKFGVSTKPYASVPTELNDWAKIEINSKQRADAAYLMRVIEAIVEDRKLEYARLKKLAATVPWKTYASNGRNRDVADERDEAVKELLDTKRKMADLQGELLLVQEKLLEAQRELLKRTKK